MDLIYHLNCKYEREFAKASSCLLGHALRRFSCLTRALNGLQQGLYIVGAETNIGKTAFMTNLFLDAIQSNDDVKGIYFSFDDNKDTIINRFLAILTSLDINQVQSPKSLTPLLGTTLLDIGYDYLKKLAQSNRLAIYDMNDVNNFEEVTNIIEQSKNNNLVVCIDGIYNLSTNVPINSIREDNIFRANKLKAFVDSYKIPVIATVEVRKKDSKYHHNLRPTMHDIMETSKFGYNAHVVFMLHPESIQEFKEQDNPSIIITVEKNKLSAFTGTHRFKFLKAKGYMVCEEIDDQPTELLNTFSVIDPLTLNDNTYQY